MSATPDLLLHCRHCGGSYVQMLDLLYHRCGQPAKQAKPPRRQLRRQPKKGRGQNR